MMLAIKTIGIIGICERRAAARRDPRERLLGPIGSMKFDDRNKSAIRPEQHRATGGNIIGESARERCKVTKNYWRALVIRIIGKNFGKDMIVAAFVFGVEEERLDQELSAPRAACNVYLAIF